MPAYKLRKAIKIMIIIFVLLITRIGWIQFVQGAELKELASRQQTLNKTITPNRGNIYDAKGKALAISVPVDTITINPSKFIVEGEDKEYAAFQTKTLQEKVAKGLSEIFSLDYNTVLSQVQSENKTETIIKKVDNDLVNKLKEWRKEEEISDGINIDSDSKRYYPYENLASHVIGFTGTDSQGLYGIERKWDSTLEGTTGKILTIKNVAGSEISDNNEQYVEVENGSNLYLTMDVNIQSIVERYLEKGVTDNKATAGSAILMNPKTGDILAMATYPNYNLNDPFTINIVEDRDKWDTYTAEEKSNKRYNMWRDRNFSSTYEPGSTFKLIISAVALEEEITGTDIAKDFQCEGFMKVGEETIKCAASEVHGDQTLRLALRNSCNAAFIQLGKRIGATKLYKYFDAFGFFEKSGIDITGEMSSRFHELDKVGPVELATTSFGQRFNITPLQLTTAVSAIANGGKLIRPKIVKKVSNPNTGITTEMETKEVRRVISEETAKELRDMMRTGVENKEKILGDVKGYAIGGKTGTSEPDPNKKEEGYVVSYIAIAPAEEPEVVGLVVVYNPEGENPYGSRIAAPILSNILTEVLPYMGIASENADKTSIGTTNAKMSKVPDVTNKTLTEAKRTLENLGFKVVSKENSNANSVLVKEQVPTKDMLILEGGTIALYTEEETTRTSMRVPNITRKNSCRSKS